MSCHNWPFRDCDEPLPGRVSYLVGIGPETDALEPKPN